MSPSSKGLTLITQFLHKSVHFRAFQALRVSPKAPDPADKPIRRDTGALEDFRGFQFPLSDGNRLPIADCHLSDGFRLPFL